MPTLRHLALLTKCERKKAVCPLEIVIHVAQDCTACRSIHGNRANVSNIHSDTNPGTTRKHAGTQNTDRQMGSQMISLPPWRSLKLSVITTDVPLLQFNISNTKKATFWRILPAKNSNELCLKDAPSRVGWGTVSRHLLQQLEHWKRGRARAIKKPLFYFLIISGGL